MHIGGGPLLVARATVHMDAVEIFVCSLESERILRSARGLIRTAEVAALRIFTGLPDEISRQKAPT